MSDGPSKVGFLELHSLDGPLRLSSGSCEEGQDGRRRGVLCCHYRLRGPSHPQSTPAGQLRGHVSIRGCPRADSESSEGPSVISRLI